MTTISPLGEEAVKNVLIHHGVKGMKWGIRNSSSAAEEGGAKAAAKANDVNKSSYRKSMAKTVAESAAFATVSTGLEIAGGIASGPVGAVLVSQLGGYAASKAYHSLDAKKFAKADRSNYNKNYTKRQQNSDFKTYGAAGVERINNDLNAGMTRKAATTRESKFRLKQGLVSFGTSYVTGAGLSKGGRLAAKDLAQKVGTKASTNRVATRTAQSLAKTRGLPKAPIHAKPNKHGVHDISSMKRVYFRNENGMKVELFK